MAMPTMTGVESGEDLEEEDVPEEEDARVMVMRSSVKTVSLRPTVMPSLGCC